MVNFQWKAIFPFRIRHIRHIQVLNFQDWLQKIHKSWFQHSLSIHKVREFSDNCFHFVCQHLISKGISNIFTQMEEILSIARVTKLWVVMNWTGIHIFYKFIVGSCQSLCYIELQEQMRTQGTEVWIKVRSHESAQSTVKKRQDFVLTWESLTVRLAYQVEKSDAFAKGNNVPKSIKCSYNENFRFWRLNMQNERTMKQYENLYFRRFKSRNNRNRN
jgi:hypothetical protein